jgi:hypothetical protein
MSLRPPGATTIAIVGAGACALLAACGALAPRGVLPGWLIAFVVAGQLPFGALALLCTARLTGGRWARAANPTLLRVAAATPLLWLAFAPVVLGAAAAFPWAANQASAARDVGPLYLNVAFFALRGSAALIGLSALALLLMRGRGGRLLAAVGLVFYAIAVDFTSIDWILSLSPRFSSSAFGAEMAIRQILAALALLLLLPASRREDIGRDLAGLTLAAALGALYLEAMSLIVVWYGDQPDGAAWYLDRVAGGWLWLALAALLLGALAPILALLFAAARNSPQVLRFIGASILLGVALHDIWLMAPNAAPLAAPAALLGLIGLGGSMFAFSSWLWGRLAQKERANGA